MANTDHHHVTQARSRAVIFGYLAAAAARVRLDRASVVAWFEHNRLGIGDRGLRDALSLRRLRLGEDLPTDADPADSAWIQDAVDFDATKLDLDLAVVVFPPSDRAGELVALLRSTERVVRVYQGYDGDLVALIVYDGARERRRLHALLEEHDPGMRWIVIRDVDDSPAGSTWLSIAHHVAGDEGFLTT